MQRAAWAALAASTLFALACGEGNAGGGGGLGTPPATKQHPTAAGQSWTVMVYMLADNDLESFALQDLGEMMEVGSTGSVQILAQVDRASALIDGSTEAGIGGLANFEGGKRVRVNAGSLQELADVGEPDMGSPETVASFIEWAKQTAPADRYALIFWDHGGAWTAFGYDASHGSGLSLPELKQGISQGMQRAGIEQFGLIGFDACLMATWETAATLKDFGEYLLASEELEPGDGWDYAKLSVLTGNPGTAPVDLGKALLAGYRQQAIDAGNGDSITLSLTDLYQVDVLNWAVGHLASALGEASVARAVGLAREGAVKFGEVPSSPMNMVDLGNFASLAAANNAGAAAAAAAVSNALSAMIVQQAKGTPYAQVTGLSIYLPPTLDAYDMAYDAVADAGAWREFLRRFFNAGESISTGPRFVNLDHEGELSVDADLNVTIEGELVSTSNVVGATLTYGIVDGQGDTWFAGDQPAVVLANGVVFGTWDLMVMWAVQPAAEEPVYASISVVGQNEHMLSIPFEFRYAGAAQWNEVVLVVGVDAFGYETGRAFYARINGVWGELIPGPGDELRALRPVISAGAESGWVSGIEVFDAASTLELERRLVANGEYGILLLTAEDYSGNTDFVMNVF